METNRNQIEMRLATDTDLVHSAKTGDGAAFEELVKRYTRQVFSVACHITRSREDAEDVTQETLLKACCHLKDFQERAQFSTWLTRIAVNSAFEKVRHLKSLKSHEDEELSCEPTTSSKELPDWRLNPEEAYSRSQLRRRLQKALEALPTIYSTVFVLRDIYGFSISETAATLKVSVAQVKTRLLRARLQLRENLSKDLFPTWSKAEHARSNLVARVRPLAIECGVSV